MLSIFDKGPAAPCPVPFNMAEYILAGAGASDDKIAIELLSHPPVRLSYGELRSAVRGIATGLRERGLEDGARLLLRIGNELNFPLVYLGAIYAGLIPVPTSAQLREQEVNAITKTCKPQAIIHDGRASLAQDSDAQLITTAEITQMRSLKPADPVLGDPNRLAYIIFTSGTSGRARGVCHAHRAIWARRMMHQGWYGMGAEDRLLHAGAFNWTYTLGTGLMDPWSLGATALIAEDGTGPEALWPHLAEEDVTIFAAAPGVYRKMLAVEGPASLPALRHGLSAGEQLQPEIAAQWQARTGTLIHQALGMSECSTFISSNPARPAPPGSSGRPQEGRRIAVLDGGKPVPRGSEGELAIARSDPGLMLGYLGSETPQEEWFLTGDRVILDRDDLVTYLGRSDDMMNAGGFRVSPLEVERSFATCPGLQACAAVELPLKRNVTGIALCYTGTADEQSLRAHAEETLAQYKRPRLYIACPSLPYSSNGKLNRRALRMTYEDRHERTDQT